jgi:hypothetical protein
MVAVVGLALLAGCGRSTLDGVVTVVPPALDARAADTSGDPAGASVDGASAEAGSGCVPTPPIDQPMAVSDAQPFCGGEVAVTGTTPFGPFIATEVLVAVGADDCSGSMVFSLYTGSSRRPGELPDGLRLSFVTTYDNARQTWAGTSQTMATLSPLTGTSEIAVPATVDITAADDPSGGDGAAMNLSVRPTGEVHVNIEADVGCTHIQGSFVAPYCLWQACI